MTVANLISELEYKQARIADAITILKLVEVDWREMTPADLSDPTMRFTQSIDPPKPKTVTTPRTTKPTTVAPKAAGLASRSERAVAAVMEQLRVATEPLKSAEIAARCGRALSAVQPALGQLEQRGQAVRHGNSRATRWTIAPAVAAKSQTTVTPRNGKNAVDGVEFDITFSGQRGQSLTGDYPSKGARL